jgi:hypothetical protein
LCPFNIQICQHYGLHPLLLIKIKIWKGVL